MIKILVVEDNATKAGKISEVLTGLSGISEDNIDFAVDLITAKKALIEIQYDLIVLDIQIPTRFNQSPQKDGGVQLLQALKTSKKYKKPLYIIGLTAYDDAQNDATPAFAKDLWGVIKYDETSDNWKEQITEKVINLLDRESTYHLPVDVSSSYKFDLAFVCALTKTELESVLALPGQWKPLILKDDSTQYYTGNFFNGINNISVIAAAAPQMGMTAASVLTMKIINNFRPEYLVMTGIAAGVKDQVGLGDILVADPSWDYGAGKISSKSGNSSFVPDAKQLRIATDIMERFETLSLNRAILDNIHKDFPDKKPDKPLSLFVGPVASGSSVVTDPALVASIIKHNRKLIGLEMEVYGVYYAAANCTKPRPITFAVKSVCDFADTDKNDNYHKYAAYTSSRILYEFVTNYIQYCSKEKHENSLNTAIN